MIEKHENNDKKHFRHLKNVRTGTQYIKEMLILEDEELFVFLNYLPNLITIFDFQLCRMKTFPLQRTMCSMISPSKGVLVTLTLCPTEDMEYQFCFQNVYSGNVFQNVVYTETANLMKLADNCFIAVFPNLDKIEIWKSKELAINSRVEKTYECQSTIIKSYNESELSTSLSIHKRLLQLNSSTFVSAPESGCIKIYHLGALNKPPLILTTDYLPSVILNLAKAPNGNLFVLYYRNDLILFNVDSAKPTKVKHISRPKFKSIRDIDFNCNVLLNNDQSTVIPDDDIKQKYEDGFCIIVNALPVKNPQQVDSFVVKTGNLHFWQKNNKSLPKNDCNETRSLYQCCPNK